MPFSNHLKTWRIYRGLSQEQLAKGAGIARPNLVALEQGRKDCTLGTLEALARALGLSPGTLLDSTPADCLSLDRHEIDRLARSFFEEVPLDSKLQFLHRIFAGAAYPTLRALGLDRWKIVKKNGPGSFLKNIPLSKFVSRDLQKQVHRRIQKEALGYL